MKKAPKFLAYLTGISLGLESLLLTSCATTQPTLKPETEQAQEQVQEKEFATREEAMKVLGVPEYFVVPLPDGYKTAFSVEPILDEIAKLYMEPVRVWIRTEEGHLIEEHHTIFTYEEAMKRVLEDVDKYPDKIITKTEAKDLLNKVYREHGRFY